MIQHTSSSAVAMSIRTRIEQCVWISIVICMLTGIGAHASSQSSYSRQSLIFANGTEGYTCFRIPAIVRTPDGTLLAFAEARRDSCADFGNVQIVLKRSRNHGKTWSTLQTVAENGAFQAGNPAPVVDTLDPQYPHGRIFLFYCEGSAPESAVLRGNGVRSIWYRTSTDAGVTWSTPIEITERVKLPTWRAYGTGPGHALQLTYGTHAGRLVVASYHSDESPHPNGSSYKAHTFFSDDHGRTWHLGATVEVPGSNESTAAQNPDGSVVLNSRDQSGSHTRILSISKDGTQGWTASFAAHDLPDPTCEGSMIHYALPGNPVLLFSNAGNSAKRWDLTLSTSRDGGKTWSQHSVLYSGPAAYSDIVVMPHSRLGILWERGDEGGIVFTIWPVSNK